MHPELFKIPFVNVTVWTYGVMMVIGFLSAVFVIRHLSRNITPDPQLITNAALYSLIAGVVGARLFYVVHHFDQFQERPLSVFAIWQGGLELLGGVVLAIAVISFYLRHHKLPIRRYLDILAIGLLLALAFGRIGCFLRGCCFGKPTDSFMGVRFPPQSAAFKQHIKMGLANPGSLNTVPIHPTQLYESFIGFLLTSILMWLHFRRERELKGGDPNALPRLEGDGKDGWIFWLFVIFYSVWRFFIEFIRDDPGRGTMFNIFTQAQFTGLVLIPLSLFMVFYWHPRHPYRS